MNTFIVVAVILASSAVCMGLSRVLLTGTESRAKRLGISALCLLLGAVLAVGGLKYVVPLFSGGSSIQTNQSEPGTEDGGNELDRRIRAEVDKAWSKHRFFALLEEADPAAADRVRARLADMARHALETGGEFLVTDMALIGETAAEAAMPLIDKASDLSVSHFAEVALEQMHALRDQDPKYCLLFLFPQAFAGERVPPNISGLDNKRVLDVLAEVMDSALHEPQAPPSRERANEALSRTLNTLLPRLEARYKGREPVVAAFAAMSDPRLMPKADHAVVADVAISFYEEIMKLPLEERSQALRLLFAGPGAAR
ncbi:hypothetical protein [Paucidesulfovibrio longus]|uniref:hypothetical protein n=1 Tax=Paucidesulfovibrio longus TaxID=889 RepID=UPI0003B56135|nr:hypothetical protein [Paucidesulfovibrio longus]